MKELGFRAGAHPKTARAARNWVGADGVTSVPRSERRLKTPIVRASVTENAEPLITAACTG